MPASFTSKLKFSKTWNLEDWNESLNYNLLQNNKTSGLDSTERGNG